MCSGVVGSNNSRPLNIGEFRGFALSDGLAPLIFVNGADSKAGQMFTLIHEVAHIWLGLTAVSDQIAANIESNDEVESPEVDAIETWCNRVAAEVLVPLEALSLELRTTVPFEIELQRLARVFKVSTLVIIRRLHELGAIGLERMWAEYHREVDRIATLPTTSGGNFYLTVPVRASKRFTRALVANTLEGQTLFRDALRMLGMTKVASLRQLAQQLK
jgi:Zn-dependent peptidase ImmA (M78 family)